MSQETVEAREQIPIDPSIYWERSGVLAKASAQGALFSLYLAMQQHSVAEPFEIEAVASESDDKSSIESKLASLNYYRRPSLAANESEWGRMRVLSELVSQDYAAARLYLSMNPSPLSQTDDAKRLPDDVVDNCSLATQKRLKKEYAKLEQVVFLQVTRLSVFGLPCMMVSIIRLILLTSLSRLLGLKLCGMLLLMLNR